MWQTLRVWVHGCDPGTVSDGSRLALYQIPSIECPSSIFFWQVHSVIIAPSKFFRRFCFVMLFFCLLPLDLCRCFSVFFLSSRPRTGYLGGHTTDLGGHTTDYSCELSGTAASAEPKVPKRGSYHSTTPTSVRGTHGQTTRRAPPEAADGRKTSRGGRSRQGTPGAELDGLSQGRLPSVRSHRRLYDEQPAHIRS